MMLRTHGFCLIVTVLLVLSGCTSSPPVAAPPAEPAQKGMPLQISQAATYHIDPDQSSLHILVYRGGPMARLGHNHVISSHRLVGRMWLGATLESSGFEISVPVLDLIVDDEAARAAHGEDFKQPVSDDAKSGTKANMLRETLLDGARHPTILIQSVSIEGGWSAPSVKAAITIKGQTREVVVPVGLERQDSSLRVEGTFSIRQSDFGITPLSIAGGALQVVDTVRIEFLLIARRP